jgi:hypothetical protein
MLTIITSFRSFDHPLFSLIQNNAVYSWLQLDPKPEILVFGDNHPGVAEICGKYGLKHVLDVETTPYGTPLGNSVVEKADELAVGDHIMWVSSDMILFPSIVSTSNFLRKRMPEFMAGLRRTDVNVDFSIVDLEEWHSMMPTGTLGHQAAGDVFLYTRGFFVDMPPFAIGRSAMDNWMVHAAIVKDCCVDITGACTVLHQNHDVTPDKMRIWTENEKAEYVENQRLWGESAASKTHRNFIAESNWVLNGWTDDKLQRRSAI